MIRKSLLPLCVSFVFSAHSYSQVAGITVSDETADLNDTALVNKHFLGTIGRDPFLLNAPAQTDWWSVVNIRHRNGAGDGYQWGTQIAMGMTYNKNRMFFRGQASGFWQPWTEVLTTAMPRVLINNATDDNSTALQVNGDASASAFVAKQLTSPLGSRLYSMHDAQNRVRFAIGYATPETGSNKGSDFAIYSYDDAGGFIGMPFMIERATGNVGIGTAVALAGVKLAVNGVVQAKKVKVTASAADWPDYVFDQDYRMLPLEAVASYIKAYKHLPEIPSAAEVAVQGHDLGEMNKKLLKKIEELTLYLIDQQQQLQEQGKKHAALQAEVNQLRSWMKAQK